MLGWLVEATAPGVIGRYADDILDDVLQLSSGGSGPDRGQDPGRVVPARAEPVCLHDNRVAVQLIEQLGSQSFDPSKYQDEYREHAMALIEQKVAGQEITVGPARTAKGQIIDLMEALKASLADRGKAPAQAADTAAARRPARAKGRAAAGGERVRKSK